MTATELWHRTAWSSVETADSRIVALLDRVEAAKTERQGSGRATYLFSEVLLALKTGFALASQHPADDSGAIAPLRAKLEGISEQLTAQLASHQTVVSSIADAELSSLSAWYSGEKWIPAIQDGVPHEFWFALRQRDLAEANINSRHLVGITACPVTAPVRALERTDQTLHAVGAELWEKDPADNNDAQLRLALHPRDHWWWWLDVR